MSFQTYALVPSSGQNNFYSQTNTQGDDQNIFSFIQGLLRQEQRSKHYQGQLESRINGDSAEQLRSRAHFFQLQKTVQELHNHKAQLEISLAHTAEACRVMARDLGLERARVQELESRLNDTYPSIDSLLQRLASVGNESPQLGEDQLNGHLLLENQRQQEVIATLQSKLQTSEETTQQLKNNLKEVRQEARWASLGQSGPNLFDAEVADESSEGSCLEIITQSPTQAK